MATIGTESNGHRRILFVAGDGRRKTIRLGKASQRDAEGVMRHVEHLAASVASGQPLNPETSRWLEQISDTLHHRVAAVGLVESRSQPIRQTLAAFIDGYLSQRKDLKPSTLVAMRQSRIWLVRHVGEDRRLDEVTVADADQYKAGMVERKLAKATIGKKIRYARHFFEVAIRRGLVDHDPFGHIPCAVVGNPARREYVAAEIIHKVLEVVPDPQWRLLIGLARWGGLRIPSEAGALTWGDVDFENKRFIVRAAKTEHHADGGVRVCPMFHELEPLFQAAFDAAEEGETRVLPIASSGGVNLRTQFERYICRAGQTPWGKLFQNLRASRATELVETFPSHVCAAWLGHSEKIAERFYRTVTDAHFQKAVASSAAQNPAQLVPARPSIPSQAGKVKPRFQGENGVSDAGGAILTEYELGGTGPEHFAETPEIPHVADERGTESGTVGAQPAHDPTFADLLGDVLQLPLDPAAKAEIIRQLLAERKGDAM